MDHGIVIYFSDENIKKYIKNHEELVIKNKFFKIIEGKSIYTITTHNTSYHNISYHLILWIDSQEKIYELNKLFNFFIKHKCFFYEPYLKLFNIDKDLFYKSGYWFLNYEGYLEEYSFMIIDYSSLVINYLLLIRDDKVVKNIEHMIDYGTRFCFRIDIDIYVTDFLVSKCKSELSKENYDKFIEIFIESTDTYMHVLIKNYGINFFKCMRKNNILVLFLDYLNKNNSIYSIINDSIKTNQTKIIDYLLKYGLEKDDVKLDNKELLVSLIKNDNIETFMYTIQNVSISNELIQKMIIESGEFITKEYVKILLNNGKLNLHNLYLLKKSIKNNPDIKLKRHVKKLIYL